MVANSRGVGSFEGCCSRRIKSLNYEGYLGVTDCGSSFRVERQLIIIEIMKGKEWCNGETKIYKTQCTAKVMLLLSVVECQEGMLIITGSSF